MITKRVTFGLKKVRRSCGPDSRPRDNLHDSCGVHLLAPVSEEPRRLDLPGIVSADPLLQRPSVLANHLVDLCAEGGHSEFGIGQGCTALQVDLGCLIDGLLLREIVAVHERRDGVAEVVAACVLHLEGIDVL